MISSSLQSGLRSSCGGAIGRNLTSCETLLGCLGDLAFEVEFDVTASIATNPYKSSSIAVPTDNRFR